MRLPRIGILHDGPTHRSSEGGRVGQLIEDAFGTFGMKKCDSKGPLQDLADHLQPLGLELVTQRLNVIAEERDVMEAPPF